MLQSWQCDIFPPRVSRYIVTSWRWLDSGDVLPGDSHCALSVPCLPDIRVMFDNTCRSCLLVQSPCRPLKSIRSHLYLLRFGALWNWMCKFCSWLGRNVLKIHSFCVNSYRAMTVICTLRSAFVKHCLQVWSPTIQWQPGSVRLLAPQLGHSHNWWRCNRGWFSLLIISHSPPQLCPAPDLDTAVNTVNTNIISWRRDPWILDQQWTNQSKQHCNHWEQVIIKAKSRLN